MLEICCNINYAQNYMSVFKRHARNWLNDLHVPRLPCLRRYFCFDPPAKLTIIVLVLRVCLLKLNISHPSTSIHILHRFIWAGRFRTPSLLIKASPYPGFEHSIWNEIAIVIVPEGLAAEISDKMAISKLDADFKFFHRTDWFENQREETDAYFLSGNSQLYMQ